MPQPLFVPRKEGGLFEFSLGGDAALMLLGKAVFQPGSSHLEAGGGGLPEPVVCRQMIVGQTVLVASQVRKIFVWCGVAGGCGGGMKSRLVAWGFALAACAGTKAPPRVRRAAVSEVVKALNMLSESLNIKVFRNNCTNSPESG